MELTFLILLLIISFLYSSVGHGGASGYLALMALYGMEPSFMKSSALVLNIFVSSIAFIAFYKGGHFRWKLLLPFIITSVPMAYLGACLTINPTFYRVILAVCLVSGIGRMLFMPNNASEQTKPLPFWAGLSIGAILGFISGLIGIGGGIILGPVLILLRWANMKETAAVCAMFILLNSVSGLFGLGFSGLTINNELITMVVLAIIGGMAGSFTGSFKFQHISLKYILATVLIIASLKLMLI
jgi:uncharacterized membrane protein YfcA